MRRNKFNARKTTVDGVTYDSALEAKRGCELILLERAGRIHDLQRQVRFDCVVNDALVCWIKADFTYTRLDGTKIVEDVKSAYTAQLPLWRLKKKLVKATLGIDIAEWPGIATPKRAKTKRGTRT